MATFYIDSAAGGDDGGSNWANAFPDLLTALADAGTIAGSDLYMDDGHNFGAAGNGTYISKGTFAEPINVYVVDKADDSYAGKTGTGANAAIEDYSGGLHHIYTEGFANIYGVHFKGGNNLTASASGDNDTWQFTDCHLEMTGTSAADTFFQHGSVVAVGAVWKLFNTDITFGHVAQGITLSYNGSFEWFGGTLNTNATNLVVSHIFYGGAVVIRGVDLSIMTGGQFFDGFGATSDEVAFRGEIIGCKLHGTPPALVEDTPVSDGVYLAMIGCGSAAVPQTQVHTSQGDVYHEDTVVRSFTYDGSNGLSYKMETNANSAFETPLRFKLAEIWCSANPEITVELTHDAKGSGGGGNFEDDEFWIEVEYPDEAPNTAYRKWDRTSRMATLGTAGAIGSGTSGDWTSGKTDFDKVVVQIANGGEGVHTVWACLAPASITDVFVCPKIDVA